MEKNNRLLRMILTLAAAFTLLSGLFLSAVRLSEPVFFDHFVEVRTSDDGLVASAGPLSLALIMNADDPRSVRKLSFPNLPDLAVTGIELEPSEKIGPYLIKTILWDLDGSNANLSGNVLTRARIEFDDGSELIARIGEIRFYPAPTDGAPLRAGGSSTSSDGHSLSRFTAQADVHFLELKSPMLERFSHLFQVKVNQTALPSGEKILIKQGDALEVLTTEREAGTRTEAYSRFQISPELIVSASDGRRHVVAVHEIERRPRNMRFLELYRYVRAKGAI